MNPTQPTMPMSWPYRRRDRAPTETRTVNWNGNDYESLGIKQSAIVFTESDPNDIIYPFGEKRPNYYVKGIDGKRYIINPCAFKKLQKYKQLPRILHLSKAPDNEGWILHWRKLDISQITPIEFIKVKVRLSEMGITASEVGIKGLGE